MQSIDDQTRKFISLLHTVDGRDKLYKTIQYAARLTFFLTHNKDPSSPLLSKLSSLDSCFSEARRAFRLGGFVRETKDIRAYIAKGIDRNFMSRFKLVSMCGTLVGECMDVIIWGAKIKVLEGVSKAKWEWWRNVLWMINIWYNLIDQWMLFQQTWKVYSKLQPHLEIPETKKEAAGVEEKLKSTALVLIRFIADFFLCTSMLRDYNHKGVVGLLGVVSGASGVVSAWKKLN